MTSFPCIEGAPQFHETSYLSHDVYHAEQEPDETEGIEAMGRQVLTLPLASVRDIHEGRFRDGGGGSGVGVSLSLLSSVLWEEGKRERDVVGVRGKRGAIWGPMWVMGVVRVVDVGGRER